MRAVLRQRQSFAAQSEQNNLHNNCAKILLLFCVVLLTLSWFLILWRKGWYSMSEASIEELKGLASFGPK
jgi:hypothetical protein